MGRYIGSSYNRIWCRASAAPVFIHGGGVSGWMWEEQISYFQRVHCPRIAAGSAKAV
ncbi:hypothetical protein [Bacillus mojavensis]|uniref:hypothetical protein n=1 Tax=Bacillus mojavensis TaxID=72360 RepID=UPI002DB64E5B|nr:hypothetical protein [Bacillus mojavensis]MEC1750353.1 hypothetical protein [Bacillus mojavensis]